MIPDLDSVVALAAGLPSGSVSTQASNIRSSQVSSDPTSGFHHRTCAVLDALAALCVREPSSDVIAIACRFQKRSTELIIASNNGPPPSLTLKHLESLWYILRDISDHMLSGKEPSTDERIESPQFDITQGFGDVSFQKLFKEIFHFSFQKVQKREAKYWPIVKAFNKQYSSWLAHQESMRLQGRAAAEWKFGETFKQFRTWLGALSIMKKKLIALESKAWVPDPNEVDSLIETWWFIYTSGTEILKNRAACDTWAEDVKEFGNLYVYSTLGQLTNNLGSSNQPCRLKRAIEKLSTIHLQVGTLLRFAFSRRMRFLLSDRTLQITPVKVKASKKKRSLPSTEPEWRTVLQGVFDRLELQLEGTDEEARANEKGIFLKALAQKNPIQHCECLLVAFLLRRGSIPPVSYIGVSKLSCKACFLWLQTVREVTGCKFDTQGCHDKWYPKWSAPSLEGYKYKDKIDMNFLGKVESELYENLKASRLARPRAHSDSSNSSEGGMATMRVKNMEKKIRDIRTEGGFLIASASDLSSEENE